MKLTCNRKIMHEALQHVSRVVSGRTTLPILSNVLLEASGDRLKMVAYDMEIGAQSVIPIETVQEGALTVPARTFGDVVGSLPDATVEITTEDRGVLNLKCGRSEYIINGLPADEYPSLPEVGEGKSFELTQAGMRDLVRNTIFAASTDETRAILTGVLMASEEGTVKMVATDSYRLAVKKASGDAVKMSGDEEQWQVIIPARALQELNRMLDPGAEETPVKVTAGEQQIRFEVGPYVLVSRLIEGQFPSYDRLIVVDPERTVKVRRDDLHGAIRRAGIVAKNEANKIVFHIGEGQLTITAESGEVGRAHEELAAEITGEPLEIAFNADYLVDVLGVIGGESVVWELTGQHNPGLLKAADDPDYLYVLMPMQL